MQVMGRNWRIPLPSFWVACAMCFGSLLVLAAWAVVDASYRAFVDYGSEIALDLQKLKSPLSNWASHNYTFVFRFLLLLAITLAWLVSVIAITFRILFGSPKERSLRSLLVAVSLVAMTCGLFVGAKRLNTFALPWRVWWALNDFKQDFAVLQAKWPTESGELPCAGPFIIHEINPRMLVFDSYPRSIRETRGAFLVPLSDGGIACDLDNEYRTSDEYWEFVEFHPEGHEPKSHRIVRRDYNHLIWNLQYNLVKSTKLEVGWHIVTYQLDLSVKPDYSDPYKN